MKLIRLYERILSEVLDLKNINVYKFTSKSLNEYEFDANGWKCDVIFNSVKLNTELVQVPDKIKHLDGMLGYNLTYTVNDDDEQYKKSNLSVFLPIITTVTQICKKFTMATEPNFIVIFATDRFGGEGIDSAKDRIYRILAKKHAPNNYAITDISIDGDKGIIIYNKKLIK